MLKVLENLSLSIANFFLKNNVIEDENIDVIRYGVEIITTTLFSFISVLLFGWVIGYWKEAFIYFAVLLSVKQSVGGYHAKTYSSCVILTIGIFLVNLTAYIFSRSFNVRIWAVLGFISVIAIFIFCPCGHENRPILEGERARLKFVGIIMTGLTALSAFLLYRYNFDIYRFIVLLLFTLSINLLIGKHEERRNRNE